MQNTSTKVRASEFWRSQLDSAAVPFFNNNADTDQLPPYGVVTVTKMEETTPGSNAFTVEVKIAVVSDIDSTTSGRHDELLQIVTNKLDAIPKRVIDPVLKIRVFGWTILYSETVTKDEAQSFSDVITIRAGVGG